MTHAKLTKLSSKAQRPSALNDGYQVKGYYERKPIIGERFIIYRYEWNGVEITGILTTSPVVKVTPNGFETQNSRYRLRGLPARRGKDDSQRIPNRGDLS